MPARPAMSVALINRDYGGYVGEAVQSVLDQTLPAAQVVVVDDGSTDESLTVLRSFGRHIDLVATANRGKGAATNSAVAACTGDVVVLLDSDDLMLPQRLQRLADAYEGAPAAQWVWHRLDHVDRATLEPLAAHHLKGYTAGEHDHREDVARGRLPMSTPATSALSWRRPFLQSLLPMAERTRSQDNYLKFLTLGLAPGVVLDEVLSLQGLHDENAYTTATGAERRRKQAVRALDSLPGLHRHHLLALHRRTAAEVVVNTTAGRTFTPSDRRALLVQLQLAGPALLPWLAVAAARRVRASGPRGR